MNALASMDSGGCLHATSAAPNLTGELGCGQVVFGGLAEVDGDLAAVLVTTNTTANAGLTSDLASKATMTRVTFVFSLVLIPTFALFGSIGNVLSLVVLFHHRMRSATNFCLAALAASDLLLLLHSLAFAALNIYKTQDTLGGENLRKLIYPLLGPYGSVVSARISSWLTALLSIERFIAVYCPMQAKTMCGKRHTCTAILIIYLFTALAFIPQALKYEARYTVTDNNKTVVVLQKTALGSDENFCAIYGTVLNVIFRFLPIGVVMVVNGLIIKAIRHTWSLRRVLRKHGNHGTAYEQTRITLMLLAVSLVFLVCILPGALNSIVSQIKPDYSKLSRPPSLYMTVSSVTYFLETVNSSINFIIYMAFSSKFCRTYKEICCCGRRTPAQQLKRTSTREVIRFSQRPVPSGSSESSDRDLRMSYLQGDGSCKTKVMTSDLYHVRRSGVRQSSFDMDSIKLLGKKRKRSSVESFGRCSQYN